MNLRTSPGKSFYLLFTITALILLTLLIVSYRTIIFDFMSYQYWRTFKMHEPSSGFIQRGDASIYYEVSGEGPPLVLLHGGLSTIDVFFAQTPALTKNHKVIAIDLRGQGRSSIGSELFTYRLLTADVLAVLDTLGIESADFVGWSDGGIIGLILGLEHSSRIKHLVAIGANFNPDGVKSETKENLINDGVSKFHLIARLQYHLKSPHPERWNELSQRLYTLWLTRPYLSEADLMTIRTPTLLIFGEHDNIELLHAQAMLNALVDAELVIIPDAGHNLLTEEPKKMLNLIQNFLPN